MHVCKEANSDARRVGVPQAARGRSALARVDYADAFVIETRPGDERTPEEWAQALLGGAPAAGQRLWSAVAALGILPRAAGGGSPPRRVIGSWDVRCSRDDFAQLVASAPIGLSAELLFERQHDGLLWATFVQLDNAVARAAWTAIAPIHRRVVPRLLERGG
jgi:hypothetical protein